MAQTSTETIDFSVARPGTDVILVAEEKEIHVNKEVMSTFSPYFRTLLLSPNFIESSSDQVEIDHPYEELLKCIQIVYQACPFPNGSMNLEAIDGLLSAADRFDLAVVRRFCESELTKNGQKIGAYFVAHRYKLLAAKKEILPRITSLEWNYWLYRTTEQKQKTMLDLSDLREILMHVKMDFSNNSR